VLAGKLERCSGGDVIAIFLISVSDLLGRRGACMMRRKANFNAIGTSG